MKVSYAKLQATLDASTDDVQDKARAKVEIGDVEVEFNLLEEDVAAIRAAVERSAAATLRGLN